MTNPLRHHDYERYLTTLFAPAGARNGLTALYNFNHEIARIREQVSEPLMGQIRLQWWRDAVAELYAGTIRKHEVLEALAETIKATSLPQELFQQLIDAREHDLTDEPPQTTADFFRHIEARAAPLGALVTMTLVNEPQAITLGCEANSLYAMTGTLRSVAHHATQQRLILPYDLMLKHNVMANSLFSFKPMQGLQEVVHELMSKILVRAEEFYAKVKQLSPITRKTALPALLPAELAKLYLQVITQHRYDLFAPRVAMRHPLCLLRLSWRAVKGF
jgi:NADH dehydrogenase [ubiquinone] 1 alpha subcomplex assembly factor 6